MHIPLNVGDVVLGGRFKNKRIEVKSLGTDEIGQPIFNKGRKLLSVRIEKKLPEGMWSSKTLAKKYKDKDMKKTSSGDMLQYFQDNPKKLKEYLERKRKKKMNKQALLKESYYSAFKNELEKISEKESISKKATSYDNK